MADTVAVLTKLPIALVAEIDAEVARRRTTLEPTSRTGLIKERMVAFFREQQMAIQPPATPRPRTVNVTRVRTRPAA